MNGKMPLYKWVMEIVYVNGLELFKACALDRAVKYS